MPIPHLSSISHGVASCLTSLQDYYGGFTALITPVTYCGFCLFPLLSGARQCDGFVDKWIQRPEKMPSKTRFRLECIQASGSRGCVVCDVISRTLRRHCKRAVVFLEWHASHRYLEPSEQDSEDVREIFMGNSVFRLLFYPTEATSPGAFPRSNPYISESPNAEGRVDAEACTRSLNFWMKDCSESHDACNRARTPNPPLLPTRVIKITDKGGLHPVVRLMESGGSRGEYLCLSHCWGQLRPDCITTRETYQRNKTEIPWSSLPQTFLDAISITKLLGKDLLWIDSICIIQDDEEDWRAEAAKMYTVYEGSFLTLMATMAKDGRGGLLRPESPCAPTRIDHASWPGHGIFLHEQQTMHDLGWGDFRAGGEPDYNINPLLARAWVFQERYLSRCTAHFTSRGILYECDQGQVSDWSFRGPPGGLHHSLRSPAKPANAQGFAAEWAKITSAYSKLKLTKLTDRLPALAGVARQLKSHAAASSGYRPGRYLAGLWENTFSWDIMWDTSGRDYFSNDEYPPVTPSVHYIAPTWSWASFPAATISYSRQRCDLSIRSIQIKLKGPDEFGQVSFLAVQVLARLVPAYLWSKDMVVDGVIEDMEHPYRLDTGFGSCSFYPDYNAKWGEDHVFEDETPVACIPAHLDGALDGFLVLMSLDGSPDTFFRIGVTTPLGHYMPEDQRARWKELLDQKEEIEITLV